MRGNSTTYSRAAIATALWGTAIWTVGSAGSPVFAQSINSWSLPEPTGTPTASTVQGPTDGQNPVVRPSQAAPTPVPTITPPAPAATRAPVVPAPQPSPEPRAAPSATPAARATPAPEPRASSVPQPDASPSPSPAAAAVSEPLVPAAAPSEAVAMDAAPTAASPDARENWPFWWWATPLVLLVGLGALVVYLRRRSAEPAVEEWGEPVEAEIPQSQATPATGRAPTPPAAAPVVPQPTFAAPPPVVAPALVELSLEPVGLRLSLVYATLQYRLSIGAVTDLPAGRLLGDMIGAHGSIPPEQQLAPALDTLAMLKVIPPLAAGERATLSGEIQLPLNAIRPLQRAGASFFVPLVRLCVISDGDAQSGAAILRRVYTVGIEGGGAGLSPLRLDTGPREHRELAAREVEAARDYPVQPVDHRRAAG